ncbi:MAG: glycosyltransferase [Deltaproteobacteria bacterium]|nr:glycosyltransferase [Deltaproteobacteria bacterium]
MPGGKKIEFRRAMKSICIFTNTLLNGGAEKQAVFLAKALTKEYNVWLVVYYGHKTEQKFIDIIKENNLKAIYLNGSHLKRCYCFYRFLRKESINIIFSYLLTTNFIGGLIGKIAGVKYTIGGIRNSKFSKRKLLIQKSLNNYINKFTIYNNHCGFKDLLRKGFKSKKALVIPNCLEFKNKLTLRSNVDNLTIISVGRFQKQKDYFTAIKSARRLRDHFNKFNYIIIGYGKLENQLHDWINDVEAAEYIKVIINPDNLDEYYEKADIYLMTSIFEGLSNAVLEAMSFSLPLVITNVGDNDRLVVDGKNGFLCEPKNSSQIAGYLLDLCLSYDKRIEFGERSYELLKENYSYEKFQKRYINFIEGLEL